MKEFLLTQPYGNIEEMLKSGEVAVYKEELQQGDIDKYAIVSRIGNRYDLQGNKIEGFVKNPFLSNKNQSEVSEMKYAEIEALIDNEVANAKNEVEQVKVAYEYQIKQLKEKHAAEIKELEDKHATELKELEEKHATELNQAKEDAKLELIAKLKS